MKAGSCPPFYFPVLAKSRFQFLKCHMSRIKILPVHVRNKIAAGEVIERPASVVKELIENAIDAGSTDIRIDVLRGGKRLIRVSDNGAGMDRDDALLCFEPHATSKLSKEDDLFDIRTLGFRGEALPSICSVAKVKLTTGLRGNSSGVSVEIVGGEVTETRESPFSGTTFEVRDLFFNTPARKKFLKADSTELFHVIDTVTRQALSHFPIAFTLSQESGETMALPVASGFRERILQIYGGEFLGGLTGVEASLEEMRMAAFVSKAEHFRRSKAHQFLFINLRPVKDPSLSHAVYQSFEGILPHDRHPVFFLFLDMDPRRVDFNVHPTKREVRFADKESVYRFVLRAVRDAVKEERSGFAEPFGEPASVGAGAVPSYHASASQAVLKEGSFVAGEMEFPYRPSLPFIYLGDTFIALSGRGGMTLIDHHAAHERILYERFLKSINPTSHGLLFPEQVKLSPREYRAVLSFRELLHEFGIEVEDFGHDSVIVRSVPDALHGADMRGILADAAAAVLEGAQPGRPLREALAARIACHNSVRGREILNQEELSRLLSDLEKTEHPDQCPHGRPTRIFYSLDDLKKLFKRK
jgi:DNA mismatch repair protein MutL